MSAVDLSGGGVTAPKGYQAAGVAAGVKGKNPDMALVFSESEAALAGVFTTNRIQGAPVGVCRDRVGKGRARAVVINSGNANACNGPQGHEDAWTMAAQLAGLLGIEVPGQPALDGVSLRGVIEGTSEERGVPVGFWSFVAQGVRTPSREWMSLLLEAQKLDREDEIPPEHVLMDAAALGGPYGDEHLTGHAARLDGDWKLHRITGEDGAPRVELYRLADDPAEATDLAGRHPERVAAMGGSLDAWMRSVIDSLNGADY